MGLFDKVKKTFSGITKNPTNLRNYADLGVQSLTFGQADSKGINGIGSFSDVLLGKKAKDINPDPVSNMIRATQMKGIGELNSALDTPADQIVNRQVEQEKKGVLTSAQDARRNAQRTIAQRGLQNSSLGLGVNRSIDQAAGKDIASINAGKEGLIRNQKIQDASTRIGVGGINQAGINHNTIQGQRSGGVLGIASALAPLLGSAAGAYKDYQTGQLASRS